MTEKTDLKTAADVDVLKIVLIALLVFYAVASVGSALVLTRFAPSLLRLPSGTPYLGLISVICDRVLPGVIYIFIAYNVSKLIGCISRGEPFSPVSPRRIRRIAYGVFGLGAASAVVDAVSVFTPPVDLLSKAFAWALGRGLSASFLGFGFLVIARVIEAGVRLQQDQNLTV